jgi:hypothetical protein
MIDSLLVSISESLEAAQSALEADQPDIALPAVRSARAALRAAVTGILGPESLDPDDQLDGEPRGATLDPETCGHPETFDPPADRLCRTCGSTKLPDGTWQVLG